MSGTIPPAGSQPARALPTSDSEGALAAGGGQAPAGARTDASALFAALAGSSLGAGSAFGADASAARAGATLIAPDAGVGSLDLAHLDADLLMSLLGMEQGKSSAKTAEIDIKASQTRQKTMYEARAKELDKAMKAAEQAAAKENSFWGKLGKVLSTVGSIIAIVASVAVACMLATTGVGLLVAGPMLVMTATSVASSVMDILVSTGVIEDPGWRPTLATGVSKFLSKVCGVPENVAVWVGLGAELVANIASGRILVKGISKAAELGKVVISKVGAQLQKAGAVAQAGGSVTAAAGNAAVSAVNISAASYTRDSEKAQANAEEIRASITRLAKVFQMEAETLKASLERVQESYEAAVQIVAGTAESSRGIAANLGGGGAPA